jgi:hypothetical protein
MSLRAEGEAIQITINPSLIFYVLDRHGYKWSRDDGVYFTYAKLCPLADH